MGASFEASSESEEAAPAPGQYRGPNTWNAVWGRLLQLVKVKYGFLNMVLLLIFQGSMESREASEANTVSLAGAGLQANLPKPCIPKHSTLNRTC